MATHRLLLPEQVRVLLERRFAANRRAWLADGGAWPMTVALGDPDENDARQHPDTVRDWVSAWQAWRGPGALEWRERQWRALGAQRLPARLVLDNAARIADCIGETERWDRACVRYQRLVDRWPALAERLPGSFEVLADYSHPDFIRLEALLSWLQANPASDLYSRQLPIPGMDSKWLEGRKALVMTLLAALRGEAKSGDFHACCGLRPMPGLVRMRLLDPALRERVGGLGDLSAPVTDLARLNLPVRRVFIVENLQTGLAFGELPGAVVIMRLGYHVGPLGQLPWLAETPCVYWGDLDTHGFAILSHARAFLPQLESRLMGATTLLDYRAFWGEEKDPHAAEVLPRLTGPEQEVFQGLRTNRWGLNVRLEQERIPWAEAWAAMALWGG